MFSWCCTLMLVETANAATRAMVGAVCASSIHSSHRRHPRRPLHRRSELRHLKTNDTASERTPFTWLLQFVANVAFHDSVTACHVIKTLELSSQSY
jgi:hypothetical protein